LGSRHQLHGASMTEIAHDACMCAVCCWLIMDNSGRMSGVSLGSSNIILLVISICMGGHDPVITISQILFRIMQILNTIA
jgi:hypothetical protein